MMALKAMLVVIILFILSGSPVFSNDCSCNPVGENEVTHIGGNIIVEQKEEITLKSVHGVARDPNGAIMEGVLVEVFNSAKMERVAACKTGSDGKFCFKNIPAGKYKVIGSLNSGWNLTHILMRVDPKSRKSIEKMINLQMTLGT